MRTYIKIVPNSFFSTVSHFNLEKTYNISKIAMQIDRTLKSGGKSIFFCGFTFIVEAHNDFFTVECN